MRYISLNFLLEFTLMFHRCHIFDTKFLYAVIIREVSSAPSPARPGQGQRRTIKYTGESKTITIPEGLSITTMGRGQNGGEAKKVELKDIAKGDILQIWYSDKDKTTISRINISKPMRQ